LHNLDWLIVMSRHSPQSYAGTPDRLRQAAEKHRARYELTGTVRVSGTTIRVTVRLVCLTSGQHLWVQRFDSGASDYFRAQDNIATQVVSALSSQIFAAESVRATIKSPARVGTWERMVGALFLMNTRKKAAVVAAQRLLKHAAAADPTSSPAFALLSFTTTLAVHLGWQSRIEARPFAFAMAQKAKRLNDEDGWAHVAEGYAELQIGNRPHQAIEILQRALKLNSNLAIAHYFSALGSAYAGQPDAAFKHADLAERLRPYDLLSRGNDGANDTVRATASFVAGKFGEGVVFARKALTQSPRQTPAFRQLVTNGAMSGCADEATMALKAIRRLAPDIERWIEESETTWTRKDDYRKYIEAFRMAGL